MMDAGPCAKCIRVLVVDDHAILREGIRSLLERCGDIAVVGEAANGGQALAQVDALRPDIVLMDLAMPEMDGLEATQLLRQRHPEVKVLILTQHDNQEYIAPALQAGAVGYVLKRAGGREVIAAIRPGYEKGAFQQPALAREVKRDNAAAGSGNVAPAARLTEREREVLRLVAAGKSNKEIAQQLVISPKTASVHRTNIMEKLGVRNSAELVRYVMEHRLLA
jgi:DNA-binding NarL/FixJ family response regulator